jgi:hypothetical protein
MSGKKPRYALDEAFDYAELYYGSLSAKRFLRLAKKQTRETDHKVELIREYGPGLFLYKSYIGEYRGYSPARYAYLIDTKLDSAERIKAIDFLNDAVTYDKVDDYIGVDVADNFSESFWNYPELLYHGTSRKNAKSIMNIGLKPSFETRGIRNSHIGDAVFTSSNKEFVEDYGDTVIEINTRKMKEDGFMPEVNLEPEVLEYEHTNILYGFFNIEYSGDYSDSAISPETIIIYETIPPKYLRIVSD